MTQDLNNNNKRKKTTIIAIIAVLIIALIVGVYISGSSGRELKKQLDLGYKFLTEQEYEQAIASFKKAIKIDPLNESAYLGMAETYVRMGDFEEAKSVLEDAKKLFEENGKDATVLEDKLTEIQSQQEKDIANKENDQNTEAVETAIEEEYGDGELPKEAEEVVKKLHGAAEFAWGIFWDRQIPWVDPNDEIEADYDGLPWHYYRVAIDGVSSIQDMKNYTMQNYFDEPTTNHLVDNMYNQWIERNGSLYINAPDGLGGPGVDDYYLYIYKTSENNYMISYYTIGWGREVFNKTFNYSIKNGNYIFDDYEFVGDIILGRLDIDFARIKKYADENGIIYGRNEISSNAKETVIVNENMVNVRRNSDMDSVSIGKAMKGERYEKLGERNGWIQVQFSDNETGYIRADLCN